MNQINSFIASGFVSSCFSSVSCTVTCTLTKKSKQKHEVMVFLQAKMLSHGSMYIPITIAKETT
jgi:hypothetical protein